ncbi:MAG: serine/threonine-protein phosphatase [Lachnospiraceae bacterium]|nr:serine/threonine-protein phosphatase [Lachnospiraceae bacterium]
MFVTAWIGMLDLRTGVINHVHAGHTPPVRFGGDTGFVKQKINMVLGGLKKAKYVRQEVTLAPGEAIYLYTDGVSEARDVSGNMYGEERLLRLIEKKARAIDVSDRNEYCEAVCRLVRNDVKQFADGAEQYDDITMLCLRYQKQ